MRRVFIQIVDTCTEISQNGTIEENIKDNNVLKLQDALSRFGINYHTVVWNENFTYEDICNNPMVMVGRVKETSKIVSIITI